MGVVFDGTPQIFNASVIYMGSTVGQILDRQWRNGVTRLTISLDNANADLKQSNMTAVVKNGQLHLVPLSAVGEPLASPASILGFENNIALQWFRIRNLINNINMTAVRQAQWLTALSGLAG